VARRIEDDVVAEPGTQRMIGLVEAVDHRQPVPLPVGQAGADEAARRHAVGRGFAILDDIACDRRMLDHVGEVDFVHRRHAATGMAYAKVLLQQIELLRRRPGPA
jgi:hypothetical protein